MILNTQDFTVRLRGFWLSLLIQRAYPIIDETHERIRSAYKDAIGIKRRELATPALLVDLNLARRNIEFMSQRCQGRDIHGI